MRRSVVSALIAAILLLSCRAEAAGFASVRVMLQWTPQSQFAGFYVAYEKGFYLRKGLDVFVLRGGPDRDTSVALRSGDAEFATMFLPTALVRRDKGLPLVHVGQFVNRSSLVLVAREDHGIRKPEDLRGKRVSLWGEAFEAPYLAFFASKGISVDVLPQYYSINLFLRGGVEACCAMYYNEYHLIYQAGYDQGEIEPFFLRDYGFGFPEDGLYCLAPFFRDNRKLCRDFFDATMEGWRYAQEHPEETLDLVLKYARQARIPTNRTHMRWMLDTIIPCILPSSGEAWEAGVLSEPDYLHTAELLRKTGVIGSYPSFDAFRGGNDVP